MEGANRSPINSTASNDAATPGAAKVTMGRITSSVGLVSGLPIQDTVDQLMAISARARDILLKRTEALKAEQVAVTDLTASVIGVQFAVQGLGKESLFDRRTVTSGDESLLSTTTTGTADLGTFQFTPVQQAQKHQLLSSGFASKNDPVGAGQISIRFGGSVSKPVALEHLNSGAGVERGKIRVTDRSGETAVIDLRFARTIDDVLKAINSSDTTNVTATADGDGIRLIDNTGETTSNLRVQEVAGGNTAADLGLAAINVAADEAVGGDIISLYEDLELSQLNDGRGVRLSSATSDLEVTLSDGTTLEVDFLAQAKGDTAATGTTTAANGVNAEVLFTSVGTGSAFDGYDVSFVHDDHVTVGNESVEINTVTKKLTFRIDEGNTRAVDIVRALNNDATAKNTFTASIPASGDGTARIDVTDSAQTSGGAPTNREETTIADVLATINAADPSKLEARLSVDGDRIELVDLTSGGGSFTVSSLIGGSVAEDLGLTRTASEGVISGTRRLAGLKTVLLDSLGGGPGLAPLGVLSLTDRSGATANVDLSSAETLQDILTAINGAGLGITAKINQAQNGLALSDNSGGSGNLIVANGDATNTADTLQLTSDAAISSVSSGDLNLQTFHEGLLLDSLNNGKGIRSGSFLVTDSDGKAGAINLRASGAKTVGDVLDLLNGLGIAIKARVNDSGDGILLVDTAGGNGELTVSNAGNGNAATDLRLASDASTIDVNGTPTQVIDGSTAIRVTLDDDDTLQDLVDRVNEQSPAVAAGIFSSGGGTKPFRITLASQISGVEGALVVDASSLGASFQESVAAQDALLLVGGADSAAGAALASSATDDFADLLNGVTLHVNGASTEQVTVTVAKTVDPIVSQAKLFVAQYNALQDKLDGLTFFDPEANTKGILFGSGATLRIETSLANMVTSRYRGFGSVQSLEQLGISVNDKGRLEFKEQQFRAAYAANSEDVQSLFTTPDTGIAAKFNTIADQLAGVANSTLIGQSSALQVKIDNNTARVRDLNVSLQRERETLLEQFYRLEETISQLQSSQSAIAQIQPISFQRRS